MSLQKLEFSIEIAVTPERLWEYLWGKKAYTDWMSVFSKGSYYETITFETGQSIKLLTPEGHGMYGVLEVVQEPVQVIFKHLGYLALFEAVPFESLDQSWTFAFESYTLQETVTGTKLTVEVDTASEYLETMNRLFPKALLRLKDLAEA